MAADEFVGCLVHRESKIALLSKLTTDEGDYKQNL